MELVWTTYFVQPWKEGFQTVNVRFMFNRFSYVRFGSVDATCMLCALLWNEFVFAGLILEFVCDKKPGYDTPFTTFRKTMFDVHRMISCSLLCGSDRMKSTWNPRWCGFDVVSFPKLVVPCSRSIPICYLCFFLFSFEIVDWSAVPSVAALSETCIWHVL